MPLDLNLILLVLLVGLSFWLALRVSRPLREEAGKLTPEQARDFQQNYRNKAKRTDMPDALRPLAAASDRARPTIIAACAASAASIAAYIFLGG